MDSPVEKGLFCGDCKEECSPIIHKEHETSEFWGMIEHHQYYTIESDCCHAEVYTHRQLESPEQVGFEKAQYSVWDEATREDCE